MLRTPAIAAAKASRALAVTGAFVQVESNIFIDILVSVIKEHPLVISSFRKWAFGSDYQYLTCYKGLYFYVESKESLLLPEGVELIMADQMWIPKP